jgi:Zn-dependent protease
MAWDDRDYARQDRPGFGGGPLMWLLTGRVRLFEVWGVTVYAHASLIVISALVLLLGTGYFGDTFAERLTFIGVLFGIVLLHEFGHVWGARVTGGRAEEILMTPLGGLAFAEPNKGWYSHTITIICGPLVNVLICLVAGAVLRATTGYWPLGPFSFGEVQYEPGFFEVGMYAFYVYAVSYFLLLFNLLPIYPLDGGQLLQGLLWSKFGWYKATLWATTVGVVGAIVLAFYGLIGGRFLMLFIAISCGITSYQLRRQLLAAGPDAFTAQEEPEWMSSVHMDPDEPEKLSRRERAAIRRREAADRREAERAARLEAEVDRILAKISATGIDSLSGAERRTLDEAREAKSRG